MAKPSFNFGENRRKKASGKKKAGKGKGRGNKSNAWRAYARGSNAPIPD